MNRFKALKPGESPDPKINEILEGARNGWWMDTSMFGTIARVPTLLKTILPVFEAFFGGGRIPPHVLEMMRLKTGEINDCTYCKSRSVGTNANCAWTLVANARLAVKSGPLTATSIGVGEPKLITSLTMSAGSKPNRN